MKFWIVLFCVVFQFYLPTDANAQLDKETQLGLSHVLSLGGAAKELEMTDDQQFALVDLWMTVENELQREFQNYEMNFSQNLPAAEQEELKEQLSKAINKIRENEIKQLDSVLLPGQIDRLKQIRFQHLKRNGNVFDALKDELGLSEDQIRKVKSVRDSLAQEALEIQNNAREVGISQAELSDHIKQLRNRLENELENILSGEQRAKLAQLEGKKFEFQYGSQPPKADEAAEEESDAKAESGGKGEAGNDKDQREPGTMRP